MTLDFSRLTRTFIVAEIGNNHEGDFALAEQLVSLAATCGADAVKFQTARADLFISPSDPDRLARFRSYEFTPAQWARLSTLAHAGGLAFLSTPLDLDSAKMLGPLVDAFKVASGDLTFVPLLDALSASGQPIVLSTGASRMDEVRAAVNYLRRAWPTEDAARRLAVLHCVSAYPAPKEEANLGAIAGLGRELGLVVGYSDHVQGIEAATAAVAAGARIIEKHFTLNKAHSAFRDHALSADPADFRRMVDRIREVESMLGSGEKVLQPAEAPMQAAIRRSIAAGRDLVRGDSIRWEDLLWLRPGHGVAPGSEATLVGRRLVRDVGRGELLSERDVD